MGKRVWAGGGEGAMFGLIGALFGNQLASLFHKFHGWGHRCNHGRCIPRRQMWKDSGMEMPQPDCGPLGGDCAEGDFYGNHIHPGTRRHHKRMRYTTHRGWVEY